MLYLHRDLQVEEKCKKHDRLRNNSKAIQVLEQGEIGRRLNINHYFGCFASQKRIPTGQYSILNFIIELILCPEFCKIIVPLFICSKMLIFLHLDMIFAESFSGPDTTFSSRFARLHSLYLTSTRYIKYNIFAHCIHFKMYQKCMINRKPNVPCCSMAISSWHESLIAPVDRANCITYIKSNSIAREQYSPAELRF